MKTCVLFPQTFSYNYLNGSAARSFDSPSANELYLDPQDLVQSNHLRRVRRSLTLVSTSGEVAESKSRKPKLLHIEDSAQIRLLVSIFLKNEFDIDSVHTGEQAIKQVKDEKYDLILVDVNLGNGIDGFEATQIIREMEEYKDIPIIALTTNDYNNVREQCISSRINAYIQKPFDKNYLLGTIREIDKHLAQKKS